MKDFFGNPDNQRLLIVSGAAVIVFLFAVGVMQFVGMVTDPARRRLGALAPDRGPGRAADALIAGVQRAARYLMPKSNTERENVQQQLVHAGFRSPGSLAAFYGIKAGLAGALVLVVLIVAQWLPHLTSSKVFFYAMLAAGVGIVAPNTVLRHLVESRQKRLRNGFPDALDMLVVCVEAGLGLTAAIQRVADEMRFSHPDLAAELALVNAETRAGVERETALKNLTDRTGLDDVRGLVGLLIQTLRFGTSIADTLRVYSEEFRDKRMQRAEEAAAKVGTKLIFPLVLCLFPSFFLVAVGPAVMRIIDVFSQLSTSVVK